MLDVIFANKSVSNILLFLFVNGKCYGTQVHRSMGIPLTPVQHALMRLEKGGVIVSHFEGKTRLYQFNPAFPLIRELEQLLQKAYTLLPTQKKKSYYLPKHNVAAPADERDGNQHKTVEAFWELLSKISRLTFQARTKGNDADGWNGRGTGEVAIEKEGYSALLFYEKGSWLNKEGGETRFSNTFRWTMDRSRAMISLEHLRRGPERPVFLFHLAPTGNRILTSVDSHLCEGDAYFGQIHFSADNMHLRWRVIGPAKNEEINYYYAIV